MLGYDYWGGESILMCRQVVLVDGAVITYSSILDEVHRLRGCKHNLA